MENVNITALNNRFQISDNFTYLLFHWREQAITPPTRPDRVTTEQQQKKTNKIGATVCRKPRGTN